MKRLSSGALLLGAALSLSACGKATVKTGATAPGFALPSLRTGGVAVLVESGVARSGLTPSYDAAFTDLFASPDSLSARLAARLVDSLNGGAPRIPAALAPALNPRYLVVVRDLALARGERELPTALLPTGGQQSLQGAGGGTSESWTFAFEVKVWEVARRLPDEGESEGMEGSAEAQGADTANGLLRHAFSVTSAADVPLYAYKTALLEAVNVAADKAVRHLRGP